MKKAQVRRARIFMNSCGYNNLRTFCTLWYVGYSTVHATVV